MSIRRSSMLLGMVICVLLLTLAIPQSAQAAIDGRSARSTPHSAEDPWPYVSYWPYWLLNLPPEWDNMSPHEPYAPAPADGAISQPITTTLSWSCGDREADAITYDVYFAAEDDSPDVPVSTGNSSTYYDPGGLAYKTTYYWQVVATDEHGESMAGPVWSFTTAACEIDLTVEGPFVDGLGTTFEGSATSVCSTVTRVAWQWGDGASEDSAFPNTHTYALAGTYPVTVTAHNDRGDTAVITSSTSVGLGADICTIVSEIPVVECQSLVALYQATAGDSWDDNTGWLQTNQPCRWRGINCTDGHVSAMHFNYNGLAGALPPELGNLVNLESIFMYHNALTEVPAEIGNLTNLTYLSLGDNAFTSVPVDLWNLVNLQYLILDRNELTGIPSELGNLTRLKVLSLSYNELTSVPSELWDLATLESLGLSDNEITSVPGELGNLVNLQKLYLDGTAIASVPPELWDLVSLRTLRLDRNALASVPTDLGNLVNLTELNLASNSLTSLPTELGNLVNLQVLRLSGNGLMDLPPEIGDLVNLTLLYLNSNALTSVPAEMGNLVNLNVLSLYSNGGLTGPVPEFLTTLNQLTYFGFMDTQWCVPASGPIPEWLATIDTVSGTGITCPTGNAAPFDSDIRVCRAMPGMH